MTTRKTLRSLPRMLITERGRVAPFSNAFGGFALSLIFYGAVLGSVATAEAAPYQKRRSAQKKPVVAQKRNPVSTQLPLDASVWALFKDPARGPAQSIGSASAGCVQGAESLSPDGPGYQVMRLSRGRFYGHPTLIAYLQKLGAALEKEKAGPMLVGDLGLPRGGWMKSGHASHQTGIDVDIWYWVPDSAKERSLTLREREVTSAKSLVPVKYSPKIETRWWKAETEKLIQLAAGFSEVDRIFVNAAIKKELCRKYESDIKEVAWLRKLRPWYAHDDHLHVRLVCPADSPDCKKQDPIPAGSGCDSSLDWWFTQDARDEALKNAQLAALRKDPPPIAEGCERLLSELVPASMSPEL